MNREFDITAEDTEDTERMFFSVSSASSVVKS